MSLKRWQDKWAGYRTIVVAVLGPVLAWGGTFVDVPGEVPTAEDVATVVDQGTAWAVTLISLINGFLRSLTKTPIFTPVE